MIHLHLWGQNPSADATHSNFQPPWYLCTKIASSGMWVLECLWLREMRAISSSIQRHELANKNNWKKIFYYFVVLVCNFLHHGFTACLPWNMGFLSCLLLPSAPLQWVIKCVTRVGICQLRTETKPSVGDNNLNKMFLAVKLGNFLLHLENVWVFFLANTLALRYTWRCMIKGTLC